MSMGGVYRGKRLRPEEPLVILDGTTINYLAKKRSVLMELTYLKTFREVAKWGSYTRAAEVLGYAQSSITTQIQKLEESYGAVLLERFGRRKMKLTIAGEALLQYANDIFKLHEESKEVVSKQSEGTLSIGTIETLAAFFLPPYLQAYRRIFPISILCFSRPTGLSLSNRLKKGCWMSALFWIPHSPIPNFIAASFEKKSSSLSQTPIIDSAVKAKFRFKIWRANRRSERKTAALTGLCCSKDSERNQVNFQLSYEFGNIEAIKQCVIYGLGIALLPRIVRLRRNSERPSDRRSVHSSRMQILHAADLLQEKMAI